MSTNINTNDYIKLPLDSRNTVIRLGDTVIYNNGVRGEAFAITVKGKVLIKSHEGALWWNVGFEPENITVVCPPYDITYTKIEPGMYLEYLDIPPREVSEVSNFFIHFSDGSKISWYRDCKDHYKIVQQEDSQEKINIDMEKVEDSCSYWSPDGSCMNCRNPNGYNDIYECDIIGLKLTTILDLLRLQRVLDGVESKKKVFPWKLFKTSKIAVHCSTKDLAKDFCNKMHEKGLKWISGRSYLTVTNWDTYEEETCYSHGTFADVFYYRMNEYTILNWEDYED